MTNPPLAGQTVLAVFAHPDDESLACGGTLARLAEAGARVVIWSASRGERGAVTGPARDDRLGTARTRELQNAAAVLGAWSVIVSAHPDGDLQWAEVSEFQAELLLFMRRHQPAAVITFGEDGLYWHRDHIGVHERTTAAVRALGADAPPLYYVTMVRATMPAIVAAARAHGWTPPTRGFWSLPAEAFGLGAEEPTIVMDVRPWAWRKLTALRCHTSQLGADHPFSNLDEAGAARLLGVEYFHRAPIPTRGVPVLEPLCASTR